MLLPSMGDPLQLSYSQMGFLSTTNFVGYFVALPLPDFFLFISIGCFGIVAWSVPSIISTLVTDYAGHQRIAAFFRFVTFIFGIGLISGPHLAGLLTEKTGNFSNSYMLAFLLALTAAVFSFILPSKKQYPKLKGSFIEKSVYRRKSTSQ